MTRTSGGLSFVACDVEVSQDNVTWTDLSDYGGSVAPAGGDRATGEQNVFSDEIPIVMPGKKASKDLVLRFVYTEGELEPFHVIRGWDVAVGGIIYARYWPKGKHDLNLGFSTGKAIITHYDDPGGEAGPGEVVMIELAMKCEELAEALNIS